MDLKLADNVVYAILAAIVILMLLATIVRIVRINASLRYDEWAPKELERASWPAPTQELNRD